MCNTKEMRIAKGVAALLFVVYMFSPLAAAAQIAVDPPPLPEAASEFVPPDWIDSSGRISLRFVSLGWRRAPPESASGDQEALLDLVPTRLATTLGRACGVLETPAPFRPNSQREANEFMRERMVTIRPGVSGIAVSELGGVTVLSRVTENNGLRNYWRHLLLVEQGKARSIAVTCGGQLPIAADEAANMNQLLDSLTILPASPQ